MASLRLRIGDAEWVGDADDAVDVSVSVQPYELPGKQSCAFHLPGASAAPFTAGSFVCAVDAGASVNCPVVSFCAHSNGTHTECVGHVLPGHITLDDVGRRPPVMAALLLTVRPRRLGDSSDTYPSGRPDDMAVTSEAVADALAALSSTSSVTGPVAAVCLRTREDADGAGPRDWSGSNPPYLTGEAVVAVRRLGAAHVLVDLPSLDREDDRGHLIAHRTLFGIDAAGRPVDVISHGPVMPPRVASEVDAVGAVGAGAAVPTEGRHLPSGTITELCVFPSQEHLPDGLAALMLHVAPMALDAAPSRPLLVPLRRVAVPER